MKKKKTRKNKNKKPTLFHSFLRSTQSNKAVEATNHATSPSIQPHHHANEQVTVVYNGVGKLYSLKKKKKKRKNFYMYQMANHV